MTDRELKKLSREDLLEILIEQAAEIERLKAEAEELRKAAEEREIKIHNAGSIAEASLALNGIFESAQASADQYLENIRNTEAECEQLRKDTELQAAKMLKAAETLAEKKEKEAKEKAEKYWNDLSGKLERFYEEHPGLREAMKAENN